MAEGKLQSLIVTPSTNDDGIARGNHNEKNLIIGKATRYLLRRSQ